MRLYAGPERPGEEIAKLLILESLEVRSINGEAIPGIPRVIRSGERRLDLLPGGYDVVLYYDEVWQLGSNNEEVVRSELQLVSLELEAGHTYRLEHRPPIDLEDARLLVRGMRVPFVDLSSGQPVQLAVESRPAVVSTPLVVTPILSLEVDAIAAPAAGGAGSVGASPSRGSDVGAAPVATGAPAVDASEAISAVELPKFWWRQASPEERAHFRGWIEE
jgi:uncharacterized protein YccT (UPF0319 family)